MFALDGNILYLNLMKEFFNHAARPEIDTIRLFLKVDLEKCDLRKFFLNEFSKEICTLEPIKDERGGFVLEQDGRKVISKTWERQRLDFRFSSFSKMQIFEDRMSWGKHPHIFSIPVICIEYSVPKFYKFTNGINRGVSAELAGVHDFLEPVIEALFNINLKSYWNDTEENIIIKEFSNIFLGIIPV